MPFDELKTFLKHPEWRSQHGWRKAIWHTMSRLGLTGAHALPMSRRWVEIHRRRMPLANLHPAHAGLKVVQISDLHYSPVVWERYLLQFVGWVNDLNPDVVVVTGDLITGGYKYAHRIATILSHLRPKHATICTLGNHDYSIYGRTSPAEGRRRADYLQKCLQDRNLVCLRNETWQMPAPDGAGLPLTVVGLDDEWTGHIDPDRAFATVSQELPTICLNHNPANCLQLMPYPWQWMLAGHTHGRQLATTAIGKRFNAHRKRAYTHGYYAVNGRHLYVNRGLSYGQRTLDWCRPEITLFKLQPAEQAPIDAGLSTQDAVPEALPVQES